MKTRRVAIWIAISLMGIVLHAAFSLEMNRNLKSAGEYSESSPIFRSDFWGERR